ncbi:MAG: CehA/McbA family metallohydrolase [Massilia sp.]
MRFARYRLALAMFACAPAWAAVADHREFSAELNAPWQGDAVAARAFTLAFDFPLAPAPQRIDWQLVLRDQAGKVVRQWDGSAALFHEPLQVVVRWDGRLAGVAPRPGVYHVTLRASAREDGAAGRPLDDAGDADVVEQRWDIAVGQRAMPTMAPFAPLPMPRGPLSAAPAPAALPYTVWLGNLHSQTGHSDGGGALENCHGAQEPQSSPLGPAEAFAYARGRGLDILVASEHNHMYDGSDGTNPDADTLAARALYQSGLAAAAAFNALHPDFIAVYGLEWGVINHGGHMNIFNSSELLGWERNREGELVADRYTAKGDYAGLYSLMRAQGWIGQFNHPAAKGQFMLGGVALGYSADGDEAMALCEVVNSTAFSVNTTETETRRSTFEGACNKALEAGYHVAFSSNQDNHCANWGVSAANRTGVLIPNGAQPGRAALIDALRARRVFATMDKTSQLVLSANSHLMGERFVNRGRLTLAAHFASSAGKQVAAVAMMEGVPGRNGQVSVLSEMATVTIEPIPGPHFYYARLTQTDGNILWSAPVWVDQQVASQLPHQAH